jgi:hypothetical protein
MAWQLEIHHIDVGQGDATLIVVREVAPFLEDAAPIIRSVLIDGGKLNKGADVHQYLNTTVNLNNLDIMIATHYDGRSIIMDYDIYLTTLLFFITIRLSLIKENQEVSQ